MIRSDIGRVFKPYMSAKHYETGDTISRDLAAEATLYLVEEGVVLVEGVIDPAASRGIGVLRMEDQFIGLEHLFLQIKSGSSQVVALTECDVLSITQKRLQELLSNELTTQRQLLSEAMTVQLAQSYAELHKAFESVATCSVRDLVWETLKSLVTKLPAQRHETGIVVPTKVSLVSKLTGVSEEMTRRAIRQLSSENKLARTTHGFLLFI